MNTQAIVAGEVGIAKEICMTNAHMDRNHYETARAMDACCCQTQRGFDRIAWENSNNTNAIIRTIENSFCGLEKRELYNQLNQANMNNMANNIVNQLRPIPTPSFPAAPLASYGTPFPQFAAPAPYVAPRAEFNNCCGA